MSGYPFFFVLIFLISWEKLSGLLQGGIQVPLCLTARQLPQPAFSANSGLLSSEQISIYTMTKLQVTGKSVHRLPLLLSSLSCLPGFLGAPFLHFSGTLLFNPCVFSNLEMLQLREIKSGSSPLKSISAHLLSQMSTLKHKVPGPRHGGTWSQTDCPAS